MRQCPVPSHAGAVTPVTSEVHAHPLMIREGGLIAGFKIYSIDQLLDELVYDYQEDERDGHDSKD